MSAGTPFRWLGQIDVAPDAGDEVRRLGSQPKRLALLVYLALARPRGAQRRDVLLALLWPELDAARGRNALSQTLHQLRRALGADALPGDGAETLAVAPGALALDVLEFEDAVAQKRWSDALALYQGPLLPGLHVSGVPEFERWLEDERARLRDLAFRSAWKLAEERQAAGDADGATEAARRATALAPDDERGLRRLMLLLAEADDRAGALRAYEHFARRLHADLEAEPSEETVALAERLRRESPPSTRLNRPSPPAVEALAERLSAPATDSPIARPVDGSRRAKRRLLVAAGVLVAILGGAALSAARSTRQPSPEWSPRVAVAEFGAGATGDAVAAVPLVQRVLEAAVDEARLSLDAPEVRVSGGVEPAAPGWRLHMRAGAPGLRPIELSREGPRDSILAMARVVGDDLVTRLSAPRGLPSGEPWFNPHVEPALAAFREGEAAARRGRYQLAMKQFERAVELDPTFTAAWFSLAVAAEWAGQGPWLVGSDSALAQVRRSPRAAESHGDLAAGVYHYFRTDAVRAAASLSEATVRRPADPDTWYWSAEVTFHFGPVRGRESGEARPAFERVLRLDPARADARLHLARIAAREGRLGDARAQLNAFREQQPQGDRLLEALALLAWVSSDSALFDSVSVALSTTNWPVGNAVAVGLFDWTFDPVAASRLAAAVRASSVTGVFWDRAHQLTAEMLGASARPRAALDEARVLGAGSHAVELLLSAAVLAHPLAGTREERLRIDRLLRDMRPVGDRLWTALILEAKRPALLPYLRLQLAMSDRDEVRAASALAELESAVARVPDVGPALVAAARLDLARLRGDTAAGDLPLPDFTSPRLIDLPWGVRDHLYLAAARTEEARGHLDRAFALYELVVQSRGSLIEGFEGRARVAQALGRIVEARRAREQLVR
ncbi:MAG: tetratricopeptide repeat protein, partial [Gemmatimonadetes bacterium]|nr:tetratricopeptide repeat protein [Gemmatimonadota bacterium]